jgi:hypothetical protein
MKDKIFKAAMVLFLASLLATLFFGILAIRGCRHIVQQAHPTITLHAIPATSTMIACERSGRKGRFIELDVKFAALIVERFYKESGQTPTHE